MKVLIKDLSPVITDAEIVALVIQKGDVRNFQNKNGDGKEVFSFLIQDGTSSIRVTCWGTSTVNHDSFQVGDITLIRNPDVRPKKNDNWNCDTKSDYELSFNQSTTINIHYGDDMESRFLGAPMDPIITPIRSVRSLISQKVSICAVIGKVFPVENFQSKKGKATLKCKLIVFDQHGSVPVTLWGKGICEITARLIEKATIIMLTDVLIGEYDGNPSASSGFASTVILNPIMPYAEDLHYWCRNARSLPIFDEYEDQYSKRIRSEDISDQYNISKIKRVPVNSTTESYGFIIASMSEFDVLSPSATYKSCSLCKKKLTEKSLCSNSCKNFTMEMNFLIYCSFIDHTGTIESLRMFNDIAKEVIGYSAGEFQLLSYEEKAKVQRKHIWQRYKVAFRVSISSGQGKNEKQYQIISCEQIVYSESLELL